MRDHQRAARHQATKTGQLAPTTATAVASTPNTEPIAVPESLQPVSASMPVFTTLVPVVNEPVAGAIPQVTPPDQEVKIHKCEYCDPIFNTTKGLNIHKGRMHQDGPVTAVKPPEDIHSQHAPVRAPVNTPTQLHVYVPGTTYNRGEYSCPGNAPLLLPVRSVVTPHTGVAQE